MSIVLSGGFETSAVTVQLSKPSSAYPAGDLIAPAEDRVDVGRLAQHDRRGLPPPLFAPNAVERIACYVHTWVTADLAHEAFMVPVPPTKSTCSGLLVIRHPLSVSSRSRFQLL